MSDESGIDMDKRDYERSKVFSRFGRSYFYITCPFCGCKCVAYVWSLSGCGKRCPECRVMHTSMGFSFKDQ